VITAYVISHMALEPLFRTSYCSHFPTVLPDRCLVSSIVLPLPLFSSLGRSMTPIVRDAIVVLLSLFVTLLFPPFARLVR